VSGPTFLIWHLGLCPFFLPLFTEVPGRYILGSCPSRGLRYICHPADAFYLFACYCQYKRFVGKRTDKEVSS